MPARIVEEVRVIARAHAKVSMTQDRYMRRGKVHAEVADLLDRTINDE